MAILTERSELTTIRKDTVNFLQQIGYPMATPPSNSILGLLQDIKTNTSGGDSGMYDGITLNGVISYQDITEGVNDPLTLGAINQGNTSYIDSSNPTHLIAIKKGIYSLKSLINSYCSADNSITIHIYKNGVLLDAKTYDCLFNTITHGILYDGNLINYDIPLLLNDYIEIYCECEDENYIKIGSTSFDYLGSY
jgi:hypothetical protein